MFIPTSLHPTHLTRSLLLLHPRDKTEDGDYLLPKEAIILLIIVGAGFLVCCGFAIHSAFGLGSSSDNMVHPSDEQASYMAEVRNRNLDKIMAEGRRSHFVGAGAGGRRREGNANGMGGEGGPRW